MPRKPTEPSDLASKMVKAEEIMHDDRAVLEALAGREIDIETQMRAAREVMVRRRRALGELAR